MKKNQQPAQKEIHMWIKKSTPANTGRYILLAQKRFIDDEKQYRVDWHLLERVIAFYNLFHHFTGKFNNRTFVLSTWQKFLQLNILCVYKPDGSRKYTQSFVEISRKNGKTSLISVLCLWFLLLDKEADAQIILAASSIPQASICFQMANNYLKQITKKYKLYKSAKKIIVPDRGEMIVVSHDADRQEVYMAFWALL